MELSRTETPRDAGSEVGPTAGIEGSRCLRWSPGDMSELVAVWDGGSISGHVPSRCIQASVARPTKPGAHRRTGASRQDDPGCRATFPYQKWKRGAGRPPRTDPRERLP